MKTRIALTLGLSALMLGGTLVGCTQQGGIASAGSGRASGAAAQMAGRADRALADRKTDRAVQFAEAAVKLQPRDAGYRALLAQSYLMAGRFDSARSAYADVLALSPGDAHAALDLALAQTALGDWQGARATLAAHADAIPASDHGLALALAGDPKGAVAILLPAARTPGADAKTRQNLALALALGGDWHDARVIMAMDLAPAQVDQRIADWARFAQPHAASDQVAAILGVTPVKDAGVPVALALSAAPAAVAVADVQDEPSAVPVAAPVAAAAPAEPAIVFAAAHEVVQPLPAEQLAAPAAYKTQLAAAQPTADGDYYVQLGAYKNAAVAHDGWERAKRRFAAFAGRTPTGMRYARGDASFYRLSVGGFDMNDARALCVRYRAHGGRCFIRQGAGDQVAAWVKTGHELAMR